VSCSNGILLQEEVHTSRTFQQLLVLSSAPSLLVVDADMYCSIPPICTVVRCRLFICAPFLYCAHRALNACYGTFLFLYTTSTVVRTRKKKTRTRMAVGARWPPEFREEGTTTSVRIQSPRCTRTPLHTGCCTLQISFNMFIRAA
jgi:hypothetical protein